VYQNRQRVRGSYGKSLLRRRGELVERSFAHCYETGGLRRCHLCELVLTLPELTWGPQPQHPAQSRLVSAAS
jgi:hypothetical protein